MARWEPDARGRLLAAALDLFAEQGYEATTAAQIAAGAGLTRTTLFRLFADKREILFQGQPALVALADRAVRSAPDGSDPLELLRTGLRALAEDHVPEQREIGRRIDGIVAGSPELQERAAFKRAAIAAALEAALEDRVEVRGLAGVLADLGVRAYYDGFRAWTDEAGDGALADLVVEEADRLVAALIGALPAGALDDRSRA